MTDSPGNDPLVHLKAAGLAAGIAGLTLVAAWLAAKPLAERAMTRLAPARLATVNRGVVVQRLAAEQPRLLALYGGSELVVPSRNRAPEFFAQSPTGFAVLGIGDEGTSPLITLEQLASLGPRLKGRKVAVMLTAYGFYLSDNIQHRFYKHNFSRLQAGELVFGTSVAGTARRGIASLLLKEQATLEDDSFLRLGLEAIASRSTSSRVWRTAWAPFARIQNLLLEGVDAVGVVTSLAQRPWLLRPMPADERPVQWDRVVADADTLYQRETEGRSFGFMVGGTGPLPEHLHGYTDGSEDDSFLEIVENSDRWAEVTQLFRFLSQSGADALVISIPFSGPYMDYRGISAQARAVYYHRIEGLAAKFGITLRTYADREYEPFFLRDPGHPSAKAWAVFDSTLSEFYHDAH